MPSSDKIVRVQNKHIRRLQERNRVLAECLADERSTRRAEQRRRRFECGEYQRRLLSPLTRMFDVLTLITRKDT